MAEAREERSNYAVKGVKGWRTVVPAEQRPELARTAIDRYVDGERVEDIASGYGLSAKRLYALLTEHAEDQWKSAQLGAALEELEAAKQMLGVEGLEQSEISRARERARLAQWDLERVCRRIYGTDAPPAQGQGSININISVGPGSQSPPTIDITPSPAQQQDDTQ